MLLKHNSIYPGGSKTITFLVKFQNRLRPPPSPTVRALCVVPCAAIGDYELWQLRMRLFWWNSSWLQFSVEIDGMPICKIYSQNKVARCNCKGIDVVAFSEIPLDSVQFSASVDIVCIGRLQDELLHSLDKRLVATANSIGRGKGVGKPSKIWKWEFGKSQDLKTTIKWGSYLHKSGSVWKSYEA